MKHLNTYKVFESNQDDVDIIRGEVFDILRELSDSDWSVSCVAPVVSSRDYPSRAKYMFPVMNISIRLDREVTFRVVKPNVDHLISYMKSVGYSKFIYKDNMLNFNQPDERYPQKENYLPTDDNSIRFGVFEFIKD